MSALGDDSDPCVYCAHTFGHDVRCPAWYPERCVPRKVPRTLYLIGSLRNPRVPEIAAALRGAGWDVFDDWHSAGPDADDLLRDYEKVRGHSVNEALKGYAAQHIFHFDKEHIDRCSTVMLVLPAGKSGHLELGYAIGKGKPGYILLDGEPERLDVMYNFATAVFTTLDEVTKCLA